MSCSHSKPVAILLIEDRRSDVRLIQRALQEIETPYRLTVCDDGEKALAYLRREGPYAAAIRPHIILLDLDLPKQDGLAVLAALKKDPALCHIPVIVLTDSQDLSHIAMSYRLHASSYIIKPPTLDRLFDIIKAIDTFWFSVVMLFEEDHAASATQYSEQSMTNGPSPGGTDSGKER